MDKIDFRLVLLKTAFCCMVSDGHIDEREIQMIKKLLKDSPLFGDFDLEKEVNQLIEQVNKDFESFVRRYFNSLMKAGLDDEKKLQLIDFAIKVIYADEKIEYLEVKFFKNIRYHLDVDKDLLLENYPDIEEWLLDDIISDTFLERIKNDYFNAFEKSTFEKIDLTLE